METAIQASGSAVVFKAMGSTTPRRRPTQDTTLPTEKTGRARRSTTRQAQSLREFSRMGFLMAWGNNIIRAETTIKVNSRLVSVTARAHSSSLMVMNTLETGWTDSRPAQVSLNPSILQSRVAVSSRVPTPGNS
jgi:hypothetical protein